MADKSHILTDQKLEEMEKRLSVTGDSIAIGTATTGSYAKFLAEDNNMTFENKAI